MVRRVRFIIFLRDVLTLSLTAFGGPNAHLSLFLEKMVTKRAYLTEKELMELFALCQILPGPTSTQTITAIAFKVGGPNLAYLTLLVWMTPAVATMIAAGITLNFLNEQNISLEFMAYVQPITVGIVAYSAIQIATKVIDNLTGILLAIFALVSSIWLRSPFYFPVILIAGGLVTGLNYKNQEKEEKQGIKVQWSNFVLWGGVALFAAGLGAITSYLPIRLFENFYRNGSMIFGGGRVLVPLLYTEFVEFKQYLTSDEFLSGYGLGQALPGPTFSFSAFIGSVSMKGAGTAGQILGGFLSAAGIFLPGTFLIFFVYRFWNELKKYRVVKASLSGINAVAAGLVLSATYFVYEPMEDNWINTLLIIFTVVLLRFTKLPMPVLILCGLLVGILLN